MPAVRFDVAVLRYEHGAIRGIGEASSQTLETGKVCVLVHVHADHGGHEGHGVRSRINFDILTR